MFCLGEKARETRFHIHTHTHIFNKLFMKKRELIAQRVTSRKHMGLLGTCASPVTYVSMYFCDPVHKIELFNCLVHPLLHLQAYSSNDRAKYNPSYTLGAVIQHVLYKPVTCTYVGVFWELKYGIHETRCSSSGLSHVAFSIETI
jgi:hypothetical protein